MKKYGLFIAYTVALVVLVGAIASGATALLMLGNRVDSGDNITISREDYETFKRYQRLDELRSYIQTYFIEDVESDVIFDGAARGMFSGLGDPYSYYLNPEETEARTEEETGIYVGIGCQLIADPDDGLITVTRVYTDSPAQTAGIRAGDKIVGVFGEDVTGQEMDAAVDRIKGEAGTDAELTIYRDGEFIEMTVARAEVTVNQVETRELENGIWLVTLYGFEGDAVKGFTDALDTLKSEGAKGMIVDLRGNPGGNLDIVVDICDLLLPEGVIVSVVDKAGKRDEYSSDPAMFGLPMAVLVNELSASASEIMAAAVKDYEVGTVVGTQTFGKGIVQSYYIFKEDGSSMSLTTARYYTPKGEWIHKVGVAPNIVVELPEEVQEDPNLLTDETDTQLQRAIEVVTREIGE